MFDETQVQTQLDGLLALPDFESLRIIVDRETRWAAGEQVSERVKTARLPLYHKSDDENVLLGHLEIAASIDDVYDRLLDRVVTILAGNAVKTFLVAAFLLFIFRLLVAGRLEKSARFAHGLELAGTGQAAPFDLPTGSGDEIDQLNSALIASAARLDESYRKLSESEARYRDLIEGSVLGLAIHRDFNPIFVNPAFAKIFGYDPAEDVLKLDSMMTLCAPEEHDRMRRYEIDRRRGDDVPAVFELEGVRQNGKQVWLECRVALILWQGEKATQVTVVDVGERKRAELAEKESADRVRATLENVADGVVTIDENGTVESFNPSAERIFGFSEDEIVGQNIKCLMPEENSRLHDAYISQYVRTGNAKIIGAPPRQIVARRKDGSTVILELAVSESWIGGKRTFVGALRDITERIETEERVRQAQKMEAVGELTGGVAHDFNKLLTVLLGNLDLLQDEIGEDTGARNLVSTSLAAARRGADLTDRLLAFSRSQPLSPKITDINKMIPDATELLRRALGETIKIECVLAGGLWRAMVDQSQLENAVLNLAINARDAMPGGGKITIETANAHLDAEYAARHDELTAGQYVLVAVSDTGTGMSAEEMRRAFDPFFTTKEIGKGTGLGLSMVYGFAKQTGGHAAIYSEVGHGTTVKLYLPKANIEAVAGDPERRAAAKPSGNEILAVVEDDAEVCEFVVNALSGAGYRVLEAADGEEARALFASERIDLLVTDVVLPGGMTGKDVAEEARAAQPGIRVLYISGYAKNAIIHQGKLDEGVELLTKPFTREMILERVRGVLDSEAD